MKAGNLLLASGALLALLAILALRAKWDAREAQAANSALAAQNDQSRVQVDRLEKRLREAKASAAAARSETAKPREEISQPTNATAKSSAGNSARKTQAAPRLSGRSIIASDPAKSATYLANFRAQLDLTYGGAFKALGLSAQQIEKFKDLEVQLHQDGLDLQAAIESQRLDPNGPEARKLRADYGKSRSAKKAELLGDLAERYEEYSHTASVREHVQRLAKPDLVPGQTVTADQVERATNILIANSRRNSGGGHGVERGTVNWPIAREQLNGILSPAQVEWLGLFVEEDAASTRVAQLQQRLTAEFRSKSAGKIK